MVYSDTQETMIKDSFFHEIKNKKNIIFYVILFYYLFTSVFFIWKIDNFYKDIVIAPLFYLVPTGIGLLIFSMFNTYNKLMKYLTVMQLLLLSSFLGFVLISLIYNHLGIKNFLLGGACYLLYPFLNVMSLHGFYNVRKILQFNDSLKSILKTFFILTPLIFLSYYFKFIHFSPFPFRDIFQDVHFMKGALEISKFHIVNVATGDSYIPLLQVFWGVLNSCYHYNLMNSQWILPIYAFIFNYLCLLCFYSSFIKDRFILIMALSFTISLLTIFNPQNNDFLTSYSLVIFSIYVSFYKEKTRAMPIILMLTGLMILSVLAYLNRKIPSTTETFLPYLSCSIVFVLLISFFNKEKYIPFAISILMICIAPTIHKAASFIIPLVLFLYMIYFLSFQWQPMLENRLRYPFLKKLIIYSIIIPSASLFLAYFIHSNLPSFGEYLIKLLDNIFVLIVQKRISQHIGVIPVIAEWVRAVPPAFHLIWLVLLIIILPKLIGRENKEIMALIPESDINFVVFNVSSLIILLVILFSPIPYIHRIIPYPALILFVLVAYLLKLYRTNNFIGESRIINRIILPIIVIFYTLLMKYIYDMPWKRYYLGEPPYVSKLTPMPEIALIIIIILTILLFKKSTRLSLIWSFIIVILITGTTIDRYKITTKLYENCYGVIFPEPKVISHYSKEDLSAAYFLDAHNPNILDPPYIINSDPSTVGIFKAITGTNGLYSFSNLGLVDSDLDVAMKNVFRELFPFTQFKSVEKEYSQWTDQFLNKTFILNDRKRREKEKAIEISIKSIFQTLYPFTAFESMKKEKIDYSFYANFSMLYNENKAENEQNYKRISKYIIFYSPIIENKLSIRDNTNQFVEEILNVCNCEEKKKETLNLLEEFIKKYPGAVPEANYFANTKFHYPLNKRLFVERMIWIINEKTIKWAYGDVGYYPLNGEFDEEYIKKYILPCFNIIYNDHRTLILKF